MTEDQTLMSEDDERASPSDLGGDTKPRGCAVAGEYVSPFPDQVLENVLENVLLFLTSRRDRNAVSLVCKSWYRAEALTRSELFIGNCYAVAPRRVTERFRQVRAVTLKGKPRFADFNLMPHNWGAHFAPWVTAMGYHYRALEKLCLKRMSVKDEDLELLADSFPYFKELVLVCCDGFGTSGLAVIANNCRDLQSYLSHLSLFLAPESKKFYILVDNRPWLKDLGPRSAHLWQLMVTKAPNYTSPDYRNIDLGSSSKCNNKMTMRPPIANTTQERAVNRTPEKRQRVPSAYNQFIKEEIQRIKANNPDISHREAFSTAAKNIALLIPS